MTHLRLSRFFSFFISLALLVAPLPVTAIAQDSVVFTMSDLDAELSMQYPHIFGAYSENETITRPFTNIIQVQGLLSVNDELVQNITAVNLSVTDEIVQNSTITTLSATDAIIQNATIATLSTTDMIINNLTATNISVVDETVTGILSAHDAVIATSLQFQDSTTNYVGIQSPTAVSSYTVTLPALAPTASQLLQANASTPTNLQWATDSAFVVPANSQTIYVAKYGNDTTGNGSLATPYATLAKAIDIANGLASSVNPITISIGTGIYVEDNSVAPLTVTADGIAIIGQVSSNVILMPNTPANDFILVNNPIHISDITVQSSAPSATGITLASGSFTAVINVDFVNFLVGVECVGSPSNSYGLIDCFFVDNGTALMVSNAYVAVQDITLFGTSSPSGPSANNAITVTGSGANLVMNGGVVVLCDTGIALLSNATATISGVAFRLNTYDINQSGASNLALSSCTFQLTTGSSDIEIQVSDAGTVAEIVGCQFDGSGLSGTAEGTGILVTNDAFVNLNSGSMSNYTTALSVGLSTDTASTSLTASSLIVLDCTNDIIQQGSSSLNLNASSMSSSAISINDSTNVNMAFFDLDDSNALTIGSYANQDTVLLQAGINSSTHPEVQYKSSLYSTEAIGFYNPEASPSSLFIQSSEDANLTAVTTTNTNTASMNLFSDTGATVGGTSALRGWTVNKNASTSELSFDFQNSDVSDSEPVVSEFTVMQLDGFNNLLQLPTAGTKIVFDTDTNLYRSAANVLKTDSNFIVGTLTPGYAVITDPSTNQLKSSITTSTELSYVHGVTSAIQTQINGKVAKAGDIMTGTLQLPAGSATAPSLVFTGSTTTGLSAATANVLSFDINGSEKMNLSSSGLTIDAFGTAGVVHNSAAGLLTSSLIVDADITAATITNDKLADISSSNVPGDIVVRDGTGDFTTNMITLAGTTTNPTDAATKAYVDAAVSTGLVAHTPCVVVSTTDIGSPPTGAQTIDGYSVVTNDRILLVGQTNEVYNGIWLANTTGLWTYPTDWAFGSTAGEAYVLITSGTTNAGSSWLCSTPTATIGSSNITFAEFSLPSTTTGANVGGGSGQVFQSKTGVTLNFRTLSVADAYMSIITNSDNVGFSTNATSANTASEIVARDSLGNFAAGTITANLTGTASNNVPLSGGTMTGALVLPAGTILAPSLEFTGSSTGTGISAPTADLLSFDISGSEQMNIDSSGINIPGILSVNDEVINGTLQISSFATGVLHSNSSGDITSSLIVDADITAATITNDKLANISSSSVANDIVVRDSSGNFAANVITASLTGHASADLPLTGGTLTGTLTLPAGTTALPSLIFTGSTTAGLSATTGTLSFSTNALERMKISSGGIISIDAFTTVGVVHNDASGNLSSSLVTNADIIAGAGITDNKLATISTAGKVANSATTATNLNTASAIVARDASGSFAAGLISVTDEVISTSVTITPFSTAGVIHNNSLGLLSSSLIVDADITAATITNDKLANISSSSVANDIVVRDSSGNFAANVITASLTGHASADLPLTGGTLTGTLTLPAGSAATPSLQFTGSTNTGISAATANTLSFDISGSELMNLSSAGLTIDGFGTAGVVHNSAAGLLTSSLIVNADITNATISNAKLATATNVNTANYLVLRDGTGSFAAQEISMNDGILAGNLILTTEPSTSTAGNIIKGSNSFIHDFGTNNTFVGITAGNFTLSGSGNTGLGTSSLAALTSGASNTALGYTALSANTTATDNTALGNVAGAAITTGSNNIAIGSGAGGTLTTGSGNIYINANAATASEATTTRIGTSQTATYMAGIYGVTPGGSVQTVTINSSGQLGSTSSPVTGTNLNTPNTLVQRDGTGSFAAQEISMNDAILTGNLEFTATTSTSSTGNVTKGGSSFIHNFGTNNTFLGINAGNFTTSGSGGNTAIGDSALTANGTGAFNTAVGSSALAANTVGTRNTALGYDALLVSTTGTDNTAIGYNALAVNATGTSNNTAVGSSALAANGTGTLNTAVGKSALAANTVGSHNTALGNNALLVSTIGNDNTAIGYNALAASTTGTSTNTAVGSAALAANTTGTGNTAVGSSALVANTIGVQNTAVGRATLAANTTGINNTAIGYVALQLNTIAGNNTAVGSSALALNTTGINNTGVGSSALANNSIGANNTAIGVSALGANTTGSNNIAIGINALITNSTGSSNTAVGFESLKNNTVSGNTAFGYETLSANTTGVNNTAIGVNALTNNSTGTSNTAVGLSALLANTIGTQNVAVGAASLATNTTGSNNTAVGNGALLTNSVGFSNTAVGSAALTANSTGSQNTAMGVSALGTNSTGTNNTALGYQALITNSTGQSCTAVGSGALNKNTVDNNTAVGFGALNSNTTGASNTAVGYGALLNNSIGTNNTAVGLNALTNNTTGTGNVAVGEAALPANNIGSANTAVGQNALNANTAGNYNTAIGQGALSANTTGTLNTAVGVVALRDNTIGGSNTAVGDNALQDNTTGNNNTALGQGTLQNNLVGSNNTAVGVSALFTNTASNNTAVGYNALTANTTGNTNTAFGQGALQANTNGGGNTAIGAGALSGNTGGTSNTALGGGALQSNSTGTNNTALGINTLVNLTSGSNNIAIGINAGGNNATGSGNVYIGAAVTITANESNVTRIQNISGINVGASPAVLISSTGQLGVNTSTRKVKHAIEDMNDESANVLKLRPVTFVYNGDEAETKQYGLIAEEVDELFSGIVARNKDGEVETVLYNVLPVLLLNEMQKQQKTIEQQQENIENLTITVEKMDAAIARLQKQVAQFSKRMQMLEKHA